jgi:hypothetical protein
LRAGESVPAEVRGSDTVDCNPEFPVIAHGIEGGCINTGEGAARMIII